MKFFGTDEEFYAMAERGWETETSRSKNHDDAEWLSYSDPFLVERKWVESEGVVLCAGGGARVLIRGNVGPAAIVLCAGGGAEVVVEGDVAEGARILASGGGAKVVVRGSVHPTAQVLAIGGAAKVITN